MAATRRTPAEIDAGKEGWVDGCFYEYTAAVERLKAIAARLDAWAIEVGHNAADTVVPKWAQPMKIKSDVVPVRIDGLAKPCPSMLFELEMIPKRRPARTSKKAKAERKAMRDKWGYGSKPTATS